MAGLDWVLANHDVATPAIKVINMSLGRSGNVDDNPAMRDLVQALDAAGVSIVVAAGNDSSADVSEQIPAAYATVIAVASTSALAGANACRRLSMPIAADTASFFTTDGAGVAWRREDQEDVSRACLISSVELQHGWAAARRDNEHGFAARRRHAARYYQTYVGAIPSCSQLHSTGCRAKAWPLDPAPATSSTAREKASRRHPATMPFDVRHFLFDLVVCPMAGPARSYFFGIITAPGGCSSA